LQALSEPGTILADMILLRRVGARAIAGAQTLVFNLPLRKLFFIFIEVTYLDQSGPKLDGSLNLTYDIIDDAGNILLKEIGLEPVKGALEVFAKEQERLLALTVARGGGSLGDLPMNAGDLFKDFFGILKGNLAVVSEING